MIECYVALMLQHLNLTLVKYSQVKHVLYNIWKVRLNVVNKDYSKNDCFFCDQYVHGQYMKTNNIRIMQVQKYFAQVFMSIAKCYNGLKRICKLRYINDYIKNRKHDLLQKLCCYCMQVSLFQMKYCLNFLLRWCQWAEVERYSAYICIHIHDSIIGFR